MYIYGLFIYVYSSWIRSSAVGLVKRPTIRVPGHLDARVSSQLQKDADFVPHIIAPITNVIPEDAGNASGTNSANQKRKPKQC